MPAVPQLSVLSELSQGQRTWSTMGEGKEAERGQKETTGASKH